MSIRILIADDHEVVRRGLASLFADTEIEIIGEAESGTAVVQLARQHRPDVVLLDIRMGNNDGLAALKSIREELTDTRVVILSTYNNPTYIARAITLGASDYLLKGCSREELIDSIKAAASGDAMRGSDEMRRVAGTMRTTTVLPDENLPLTRRETQVLRHIALGLSNKEIGKSLSISVETVKEHVQNILRKVQASDRTQAAVWAVRKGLV